MEFRVSGFQVIKFRVSGFGEGEGKGVGFMGKLTWNKRQSERMRLFCIDGIASCVFRTAQWCVFGTHSSKSASRAS